MKRYPSLGNGTSDLFRETLGTGYEAIMYVAENIDDVIGAYGSVNILLDALFYRFECDGETTIFTGLDSKDRTMDLLLETPTVFVDGIRQDPTTYTVDFLNDIVTLDTAPQVGSIVHISAYGLNTEDGSLYFNSLTEQSYILGLVDDMEAARDAAQAAQAAAETAETNAGLAQTNAETAETGAVSAQAAAETAQTNAETAEANAETAQAAAEAAQAAAEAAEDAALDASEASYGLAGTLVDFEAGSMAAIGNGSLWGLRGPWGIALFTETDTSPDFTNAIGVGLVYAEDTFDVRVWGLTGSGDETTEIEAMCQWAADNNIALIWPTDITYTFDQLRLTGSHNWTGARLHSNKVVTDYVDAIQFQRTEIGEVALTADFDMGDNTITVDDASLIEVGHLIRVEATRLIPTGHRGKWSEGQLMRVSGVSGNVVTFDSPFVFSFIESVQTGTITAISGDRYTLTISNPTANTDTRFVRKKMRITSGAAAGEENYILSASGSTVSHTSMQGNPAWSADVQVGDSYSFESVAAATIYDPNTIRLDDVHITHDIISSATDGDNAMSGVNIDGAHAHLSRCLIEGFPEYALNFNRCWRPFVEDMDVRFANRAYGEGGGHGYGISVQVCHEAVLRDIRGYANRRSVDFSGARGYSTFGLAENVSNVGGGMTYSGDNFFPIGIVQNSVAGSHGAGHSCRYVNCIGQDVYTGHMLRGQLEVVQGYSGFGYGYYGVRQTEGGFGMTVLSMTYEDGFTMSGSSNYVRGTSDDLRMMHAVEIEYDDKFTFAHPILIQGIRANGLVGSMVYVTLKGNTNMRNLTLRDNFVTCYPDSVGDVTTFSILDFDADVEIDHVVLDNNHYDCLEEYSNGAIQIAMEPDSFHASKAFVSVREDGMVWIDGRVWVRSVDQSVVRVPVRSAAQVLMLNIINARSGSAKPRGFGIAIGNLDATDYNSGSAKTDLELLASYPSAYTDATSGKIGINLQRSKGYLTLVNNQGNDHTLIIEGL